MQNKKGFTLIELLATITILSILATISVVAVNQTIKNSKEKAEKIQKELVTDAAKAYATDHRSECKNGCKIDTNKLIDYLDSTDDIPSGTIYISANGKINCYYVTSESTGEGPNCP